MLIVVSYHFEVVRSIQRYGQAFKLEFGYVQDLKVVDHDALYGAHCVASVYLDKISYPCDKFSLLKSVMFLDNGLKMRYQDKRSLYKVWCRPQFGKILEISSLSPVMATTK